MSTQTPTPAAKTRRYVVRPKPGDTPLPIEPRLVMATTRNAALAHVAGALLDVAPASPDDIEDLVAKGIKTEYPGREPEADPADA